MHSHDSNSGAKPFERDIDNRFRCCEYSFPPTNKGNVHNTQAGKINEPKGLCESFDPQGQVNRTYKTSRQVTAWPNTKREFI